MFRLPTALVLLALAFGNTALASEPSPASPRTDLVTQYTSAAQELVNLGMNYLGIPYRFGGTTPETGLDCSGLVRHVFRNAVGLDLPRTAREMAGLGNRIQRNELQPGDLVFFNTMRRSFSHVGIYLGDGRFLHAPSGGGEVRIDDISARYWKQRFNGARRVVMESSLPSGLPDTR